MSYKNYEVSNLVHLVFSIKLLIFEKLFLCHHRRKIVDITGLFEFLCQYHSQVIPSTPKMSIPVFVLKVGVPIKYHQTAFPF